MTNYARIESRTAYLSTDFGEEIARKWFGDETVDSLPRFSRGPRKGKIKGVVSWRKVVKGGWVRVERATACGDATGYVENRVGRIFERKLHNLESTMHGAFAGEVIRDLDKEEDERQFREYRTRSIDEQMRRYSAERDRIEHVILTRDLEEDAISILQEMIREHNEDIKALVEDLKK